MSGEVVRVGMRTPWGAADTAKVLAEGIGIVSTPGHGGIKLSAARNRQVPTALRRAGGWYEEDCEAYIPMYVFAAEILPPTLTPADCWEGMRRWYPEQVDAAYPSGRAEELAARVIPVRSSTATDPDRRAQDATDDTAPYEAAEDGGGERCGTCRGQGVVRCSGRHYRSAERAQEAIADGRAVTCPTCQGEALVRPEPELPPLIEAAKQSGRLEIVTVGR